MTHTIQCTHIALPVKSKWLTFEMYQSNHKTLTFLLPRAKGSSHLTPEPTCHICTHQYGPGNLTLSQNLLQLMSAVQPPSTILLLPPTVLGWWEYHSSGLDQMKHHMGQSLI